MIPTESQACAQRELANKCQATATWKLQSGAPEAMRRKKSSKNMLAEEFTMESGKAELQSNRGMRTDYLNKWGDLL